MANKKLLEDLKTFQDGKNYVQDLAIHTLYANVDVLEGMLQALAEKSSQVKNIIKERKLCCVTKGADFKKNPNGPILTVLGTIEDDGIIYAACKNVENHNIFILNAEDVAEYIHQTAKQSWEKT